MSNIISPDMYEDQIGSAGYFNTEELTNQCISYNIPLSSDMVGKYVVARCTEAGVHAGILESHSGRMCVLQESRRLWYFKPADNAAFLSGVATEGVDHEASNVGAPVRIYLTEVCELIECTDKAEESIKNAPTYTV